MGTTVYTITSLALLVLLFAFEVCAVTFSCTFTSATCTANATQAGLLRAVNDSAPGYSNAHAQLMNYSGTAYNYTLCCSTDANHTLNNSCTNDNKTVVFRTNDTSNAHIQVPAISTYGFTACMALSPGNLSCEYVNTTCSSGYSPVLSMASSESNSGLANLTNAHIGNYSRYTLNVCCKGGNTAPAVPVLTYPTNNNYSVFERNISFDWQDSTDSDGDAVTYDFNLTQATCTGYSGTGLSTSNNTPTQELCVDKTYNWTVRACDPYACSDWASWWNFTILSQAGLSFTVNNTNFGTVARNGTDNTTDNSPLPFTVENTGNVRLNVTLKADNALFSTSNLGNSTFQYKARANEASAYQSAQTSWANVPVSYATLYTNFSYVDTADSSYIDILIYSPNDEPAGYKTSTVNISGVSIE